MSSSLSTNAPLLQVAMLEKKRNLLVLDFAGLPVAQLANVSTLDPIDVRVG